MEKILKIITWPYFQSGYHCPPWYIIAWRILLKPVFYLGIIIAWLSILISHGPRKAAMWADRVI